MHDMGMSINWQTIDFPRGSVAGALVNALYERYEESPAHVRWVQQVAKTLDEDALWTKVGPLLDALEQGEYHEAGCAPGAA